MKGGEATSDSLLYIALSRDVPLDLVKVALEVSRIWITIQALGTLERILNVPLLKTL